MHIAATDSPQSIKRKFMLLYTVHTYKHVSQVASYYYTLEITVATKGCRSYHTYNTVSKALME